MINSVCEVLHMQEIVTDVFAEHITCVIRNLVESMTKFTLETHNCKKCTDYNAIYQDNNHTNKPYQFYPHFR